MTSSVLSRGRWAIAGVGTLAAILLWGQVALAEDPGAIIRDCEACPELVVVPAGSFRMGDLSGGGDADEGPVREVNISRPFAIARYETTFAQWDACVAADACRQGVSDIGFGRGDRPVMLVTWEDAQAYAGWLSETTGKRYRLPTEAEWEYACRAGPQTTYWWGDEFDATKLNSSATWRAAGEPWPRDEHTLITPKDRFPANPFGLHDIVGNNWEWVQDFASAETFAERVRRPESPVVDPQGPSTGFERVLRGGGWNGGPTSVTCSARFLNDPAVYRSDHVSFRVVRNP